MAGAVATVARSALASQLNVAASAAGAAATRASRRVPMANGTERTKVRFLGRVRELARRFVHR